MEENFEEILDDVLYRWPNEIGWYKWRNIFGSEFSEEEGQQILSRFCTDGLLDSGTEGHFLNANGHAIKRNLTTSGYVALRKVQQHVKARQESFISYRQNMGWKRTSGYLFFVTLIILITVAIIIFNKVEH